MAPTTERSVSPDLSFLLYKSPSHPNYREKYHNKNKFEVVTKRISISDIESIDRMGLYTDTFTKPESKPMTETQIGKSFEGTQIHYLEMLCALKLQKRNSPIDATVIRPHLPTFSKEERQNIAIQLNEKSLIDGWNKWRYNFTFPHQEEDIYQPKMIRDLWFNSKIEQKADRVINIWTVLAEQEKIQLLQPDINNLHELTGIINFNFGVQPNATELHLQIVTRFDLITNPADSPMKTIVYDFKARQPEPTRTHQLQSRLMQICAAAINNEYPFYKAHRAQLLSGPIRTYFIDPLEQPWLPQFCYKTTNFDNNNFFCQEPVVPPWINSDILHLARFSTEHKEEIKLALADEQKTRGYQSPVPLK